jgi:hypothetical protein
MASPDIDAGIIDVRKALAELNAMSDWGRGALRTYDGALPK